MTWASAFILANLAVIVVNLIGNIATASFGAFTTLSDRAFLALIVGVDLSVWLVVFVGVTR